MIDNDPMPLGKRQELFMECLAQFLPWLLANGYKIRGGELQRDPRIAAMNAAAGTGISSSVHIDKLAIDLNLFRNGVFLDKTEDHAAAGAKWKSLHPLCRWGGDFKDSRGRPKPDGNHYSVTYAGRS
jgi:hypothetical protein